MFRMIKSNTSVKSASSITKSSYDDNNAEMRRGFQEGKKLYNKYRNLMEALKDK